MGQAAFLTNHIEWITGHPARSFEQFAYDYKDAFTKKAEDFKLTG